MWVRRDRDCINMVALTTARAAAVEEVLLPDDEPTLLALGAIATGHSHSRLYARPLTQAAGDARLVACAQGGALSFRELEA